MASGKYIFNTISEQIGTEEESYTGIINGTTVTVNASTEGTYYLHVLTIDRAGNKIETISEAVTVVKPGETAEDIAQNIAQNPSKYYGRYVLNYEAENSDAAYWRILYAGLTPGTENYNIYLIADDYIDAKYAPKGKKGTPVDEYLDYWIDFTEIVDNRDYTGTSDITDVRVRPWLRYLNSQYGNDSNSLGQVLAYLLDTNVWSKFAGEKAEYAIGAPTFDMFCASYNQKNPDKTIQYRVAEKSYSDYAPSHGYEIKWSTDTDYDSNIWGLPDEETMYLITEYDKADAMWIASPSAYSAYLDYIMCVDHTGNISYAHYTDDTSPNQQGLRPVVCLKSDVMLAEQPDGNYKIVDKTEETVDKLPGDVDGLKYKEGDESTGIVATDATGNEWVWIEVPKSIFGTAMNDTDYNAIYNDMSDYAEDFGSSDYIDIYTNGSGNFSSETEYNNELHRMLKSVYDNGGFWVSRYEIGTTSAAEAIAQNTTNITSPVSQQSVYPIVNKTQQESQQIVRKMNSSANLLFGIQWDLILKFFQEKAGLSLDDLTYDSTSWGNYDDHSFIVMRGEYNENVNTSSGWLSAAGVIKPDGDVYRLTTGATDRNKKMNLYDIAGNVYEWTLERSPEGNEVSRGGGDTAVKRYNKTYSQQYINGYLVGFRASLY